MVRSSLARGAAAGRRLPLILAVVVLALSATPSAGAAPAAVAGTADTGFGTHGLAPVGAYVEDVLALPDGGAVAVTLNHIRRVDPAGGLVTAWGTSGVAAIRTFSASAVSRLAVAVDPSGRVVVARQLQLSDGNHGVVAVRLTVSGAADPSFRPGGELLPLVEVRDVEVLASGRVLVAGRGAGDGSATVVALTDTGALDETFGDHGRVRLGAEVAGMARAMATDPVGRVYVAYGEPGDFTEIGSSSGGHVARLDAVGAIDPTFALTIGHPCVNVTDFDVTALDVRSDGGVTLAGRVKSVQLKGGVTGSPFGLVVAIDAQGHAKPCGPFLSGAPRRFHRVEGGKAFLTGTSQGAPFSGASAPMVVAIATSGEVDTAWAGAGASYPVASLGSAAVSGERAVLAGAGSSVMRVRVDGRSAGGAPKLRLAPRPLCASGVYCTSRFPRASSVAWRLVSGIGVSTFDGEVVLDRAVRSLTFAARSRCVELRAIDAVGRMSLGSTACLRVVRSEARLPRSGPWQVTRGARFFGGSALVSTAAGARVDVVRNSTEGIAVIADTCPTCGVLDVFEGARWVRSISLRSRTSRHHRVLMAVAPGQRPRARRFELRSRDARTVRVDGVVLSERGDTTVVTG